MRLGIIAGGGALPQLLASHCQVHNIDCRVFAIAGQADQETFDAPVFPFRLGGIGTLVKLLKQQVITDVVFIGGVRKPTLWSLRPDLFTLKQLPGLGLFTRGDDSLLRRIVKRFEDYLNITVRGIHELMPELLAPVGTIGDVQPTELQQQAIARGLVAAQQHGLRDKGQAVIADSMQVIDVERRDGTKALLARVPEAASNAVLVKLAKPQQDLRVDMPTIGPDTIRQAAAAGLCGIAVSAGKTLIVDRAATVAATDKLGLFLIGIKS